MTSILFSNRDIQNEVAMRVSCWPLASSLATVTLLNSEVPKPHSCFAVSFVVPNYVNKGCKCVTASVIVPSLIQKHRTLEKSFEINTEINDDDCRMN
jgi:hypothetical protein